MSDFRPAQGNDINALSESSALVFGASGVIGTAIAAWFARHGRSVIGISRSGSGGASSLAWTPAEPGTAFDVLGPGQCGAVVWAQGMNLNDDIHSFDVARHREVYEANVVYTLKSLQLLLERGLVAHGTRLVVISSIWQNIVRQNKLSYCVSKSALSGLVRSLAADLGPDGIMVNAVLPGPLDTPMTRANLSATQIDQVSSAAPLKSLPALEDVCETVGFLCSSRNTGITGQFVTTDRGFSHVRYV